MNYSKSDIVVLVTNMKKWYADIYKLSPSELANFMKVRSNFIKLGIVLSDEKLAMSDEHIIAYILNALNKRDECTPSNSIHGDILTNALSSNVDLIDSDRIEIRKHLFNENITVVIERVGKVFSTAWNTKMTTCKISIPSNWQIRTSQSLLLDINEKDNKNINTVEQSIDATQSILGLHMYKLLNRHFDYSIIRRLMEIECDVPDNTLFKNVDRRRLNKLTNKGLSEPAAFSIMALAEQVHNKTFSAYSIRTLLSFRKRLVYEFDALIS